MEKVNWVHPEAGNGEVLLRNMNHSGFSALDFSTKRQGQIAYDGDGNRLSQEDWLPVFIKIEELESRGIDLGTARKLVHNF